MHAFTPGARVVQPQYGAGTVTTVNQYHTVIEFDAHGMRTFATNMVNLTGTSEPAPAKPAKKTRKRAVVASAAVPAISAAK